VVARWLEGEHEIADAVQVGASALKPGDKIWICSPGEPRPDRAPETVCESSSFGGELIVAFGGGWCPLRELPRSSTIFRASSSQAADEARRRFAIEDWQDVTSADVVLCFTEQPRTHAGRGGRHVELGAALAVGAHVLVIGPAENVFCHLPQLQRFDTFSDATEALRQYMSSFNLALELSRRRGLRGVCLSRAVEP
jgi:hypothetical protein